MASVFVVATEWNRGDDLGSITIEGVAADPVTARRLRWATMREYIRLGKQIYGRKYDDEWNCDVQVTEHEVLTAWPARVAQPRKD